uniref:Uncharacterized protein n=1 Tax=Tetranychus urticae TaxID=32264 RepID=T1KMR0_TETUR
MLKKCFLTVGPNRVNLRLNWRLSESKGEKCETKRFL